MSEKDKGSSFYFSLPCTVNESTDSSAEAKTLQYSKIEHPVILVAEDDEYNFKFLEIVLENADFRVIRAVNGAEAVILCRNHPEISLVFMDMKMPVLGGLEATRLIKSSFPDLPVIALTAFVSPSDEYEAKLSGCDDFLSKPVNAEKLLNMINKRLGI
jgi:CheY-like chemotaxis protein